MKNRFARWNVLLMEYLKRDWKMILVWIVGLGSFCGGFVPAFVEIGKGQGLIGLYETMQNPAMISMIGGTPIEHAADYTIGAMYSHMMLVFCGLFAMIIAALHVVNHTRKEEENGLTEFISSYCVGRYAASFALIVEEVMIHVGLALVTGGLMAAFGVKSVEPGPSFLFGASVALAGLIGAVLALVMAQLMPTTTGTTGVTLGLIGAMYLFRAGTDVVNADLSMWNPMGWTYMTFPFTENNVFPLVLGIGFCAVMVALAFLLERGRDMGAGYVPERTGKGKVSRSLLSVPGFLFRLNRTLIFSWVITFLVLGGAYGSIYGEMQSFLEGSEFMKLIFTQEGVSLEASFTTVIMVVMVGLTAILPVAVVNRLFAEESGARMGQVYATKVSRDKVYWWTILIAVVSGTFAILAASAGLGTIAIATMEQKSLEMQDFLAAGMNYFPAVLFATALAALAAGWIPKLGKAVYIYIGYSFMMNYILGILDLPEWLEKTAALSWIPRMPVDEFDLGIFVGITGISFGLLVLGHIGYRRRDLMESV